MKIWKNNKSILFLLLIFIAIISMSIGFCNVSDIEMLIEGKADAEANKMITITDVKLDSDSSSEGSTLTSYTKENTLLQLSITMPKENVSADTNITVLVDVKNLSDMAYRFTGTREINAEDIADFPSFSIINDNPNIQLDKSSYDDLLNTIIDADNIDQNNTMTIPLRFSYINIENIENNVLNISIKLVFTNITDERYTLKTGREVYSILSTDSHNTDTTSIFFCSKPEVPSGSTKLGDVGETEGEIIAYWNNGTIYIAACYRGSTIVFNEDSGYMFSNGDVKVAFSKVTSISTSYKISIDTSNTKHFEEMFKGCSSLTTTGFQPFINKLNTEQAQNMCAMFGSTKSITYIDLSNFDTSNVTDMSWMFENDSSLINIIFGSDFKTSNVQGTKENQGFAGMFQNCTALTALDLFSFDTSNVASMWYMFSGCSNLQKIYVSDKFVTTGLDSSKIPNSVKNLFRGCTKLVGGAGTKYSSANLDASYAHIDEGTNNPGYFSSTTAYTITLDANGGKFEDGSSTKDYMDTNSVQITFDQEVTNSDKILIGWSKRKSATKPDYSINATYAFHSNMTLYAVWQKKYTYALKTGLDIYNAISSYKDQAEHIKFTSTEKLPDASTLTLIGNLDLDDNGNIISYYNETNKTIYISAKESDSVIRFNPDSSHMFSNGKTEADAFSKVQTFDIDDTTQIDTGYVNDFAEIFKNNTSVTQESMQALINKLDTSAVTNMCAMFEYLHFSTIDLSSLDTSNVTDMSWLFHGSYFTNIILGSNFDTENVRNFDGMFQELKYIEVLDISVLRVNKGSRSDYTFGLCPNLKTIYVSPETKFENSYTGSRMFENDTSLVGGSGENETVFDSENIGKDYAQISTKDTPGYFTDISEKNT